MNRRLNQMVQRLANTSRQDIDWVVQMPGPDPLLFTGKDFSLLIQQVSVRTKWSPLSLGLRKRISPSKKS